MENEYNNIIINTGNFTDLETIAALKAFSKKKPNVIINNQLSKNSDLQNYFLKPEETTNIFGQKVFILVGINLRIENPILNIRMRKLSLLNSVLIAFIGSQHDYNFNSIHLGTNSQHLYKIIEGKHFFIPIVLTFLKKTYKNIKIKNTFKNYISIILTDNSSINKNNFLVLSKNTNTLIKNLKFEFKILSNYTGKLNVLELGFFNNNKICNNNYSNIYYLIGVEDCKNIKKNDLVIFQGHHNDLIRTRFDIILPTIN
jgi:NADH-quinone oxidoreductase subunit G